MTKKAQRLEALRQASLHVKFASEAITAYMNLLPGIPNAIYDLHDKLIDLQPVILGLSGKEERGAVRT